MICDTIQIEELAFTSIPERDTRELRLYRPAGMLFASVSVNIQLIADSLWFHNLVMEYNDGAVPDSC